MSSKTRIESFLATGDLFEREGRILRARSNSRPVAGARFLHRLLVEDVDAPRGIYDCTVDAGDIILMKDEPIARPKHVSMPAARVITPPPVPQPTPKYDSHYEEGGGAWAALEMYADPDTVVLA